MSTIDVMARQPMLFLVNPEAAVERRERMMRQLAAADLTAQRVGVDLQGHSRDALRDELSQRFPGLRFELRRLGGAELGRWASHLTAWLQLLEGREPAATVIEDDVLLSQAFPGAVTALHASAVFDVVYLGPAGGAIAARRQQAPGGLAVDATKGRPLEQRAYTIRRAFVERLLAQRRAVFDIPLEQFLGGRSEWARPSIGALRPPVIWGDRRLARQSAFRRQTNRWLWSPFRSLSTDGMPTVEDDRLSPDSLRTLP